MPRQESSGLETSKHEEATQKQDGNRQIPIAKGDRTDHQDRATEPRTVLTNHRVAPAADQRDAQRSAVFTGSSQEQDQEDGTPREAALETYTKRTHASTFNPSPSDPITSERTLDFVEDLLTPLQTVPMDISSKSIANAWDSRAAPQQVDDSLPATSLELQSIFDEWLVSMTPE